MLWSLAIMTKRLKKYCKKICHNEKVIYLSKSELADKNIELIIQKRSWKNWIETTELKESDQTQVSSLIIFPLDTSYKIFYFKIFNLLSFIMILISFGKLWNYFVYITEITNNRAGWLKSNSALPHNFFSLIL